jgi:CYTH domain-containing protein
VEVERKWLVGRPPADAISSAGEEIDQGYLAACGEHGEVRLRRRAGRRFLTTKHGRGLVRAEFEVELTDEQFETLWPATEGRRVQKTRRLLDAGGGRTIELDEYAGALSGLFTAEVEFPDAESARAFAPPSWFGREVTGEDAYGNQQLALDGLPVGSADRPT